MPKYGIRGMRPIAEVGESPQLMLYGAISTRNIINNVSDKKSHLTLTTYILSLIEISCVLFFDCFKSDSFLFSFITSISASFRSKSEQGSFQIILELFYCRPQG